MLIQREVGVWRIQIVKSIYDFNSILKNLNLFWNANLSHLSRLFFQFSLSNNNGSRKVSPVAVHSIQDCVMSKNLNYTFAS